MFSINWSIKDNSNIAQRTHQPPTGGHYYPIRSIEQGLKYFRPADYDLHLKIGQSTIAIPHEKSYLAQLFKNLKDCVIEIKKRYQKDTCQKITLWWGYDYPFEEWHLGIDYAAHHVVLLPSETKTTTEAPFTLHQLLTEIVQFLTDLIEQLVQVMPHQYGLSDLPYITHTYKKNSSHDEEYFRALETDIAYNVKDAMEDYQNTLQWLDDMNTWIGQIKPNA